MGGLALVGQTWKATAAHLLVRQMGIRIEGNPEPYLIRIHVADGGVGGKKRKEVYFLIINDGTVPFIRPGAVYEDRRKNLPVGPWRHDDIERS